MHITWLAMEDREEVSPVALGIVEIIMTLLLVAVIAAIVVLVRRSRRR